MRELPAKFTTIFIYFAVWLVSFVPLFAVFFFLCFGYDEGTTTWWLASAAWHFARYFDFLPGLTGLLAFPVMWAIPFVIIYYIRSRYNLRRAVRSV
jgi:hypothetical protein